MIFDLEKEATQLDNDYDVCVVGAGAVGLAAGVKLARLGLKVAVLEAGGAGLENRSQALYRGSSVGHPFANIDVGRYRVLGGSTIFWGGQVLPFDPHIFDERKWVGDDGWPIKRSEIDPYYNEAYELLGLGGALKEDGPIWEKVGQSPALASDVRIVLSRWVRRRNFARLFANDLRKRENLHVILHANVTGLSVCSNSQEVNSVSAKNLSGRAIDVTARQFILANGALEITRLLLHPLADGATAPWVDNPWLGRGFSDHAACTVGRVFIKDRKRFHDLFDVIHHKGFKYYPRIVLTGSSQIDHEALDVWGEFIYDTAFTKHLDNIKLFIRSLIDGQGPRGLLSLPGHILSVAQISAPLVWRYLTSGRSYKPEKSSVRLVFSCEQIPTPESQVRLGAALDELGMRRLEIDWRIDGAEMKTLNLFAKKVRAALSDQGLAELTIDPRLAANDPAFLTEIRDDIHHMSTTRMGKDSSSGVVDSDLAVFGVRNLHIAGASVFPFGGKTNPTFTAIALALRLCDRLAAECSGPKQSPS